MGVGTDLGAAFLLCDKLSAYVALAEPLEYPLITRDARLARVRAHEARVEVL